MASGISNRKWFVADFETTAYQYYLDNGYTKVWLYAVCDEDANITNYGTSIEEFFAYIKKLYGKVIYFHNLKFDGEFIISFLLNNGYEYYEDLKDVNKGFSTLIGEMGELYSIDIRIGKNKTIHLHDSLKLLPFKVEKIAKDFGLPIMKLKIDYNDYTIDDNKIAYVSNDVKIVALALKQIKQEGMTRMTTASCAYNQFINMRSKQYMETMFPNLEDDFLDEWRNAYRGGRTQCNPIHQGKILNNVKRYDINSMYPSIMYYDDLPYGYPIELDKPGLTKFELYHIAVEFSLKKGHLPSLLNKCGIYNQVDTYYVESDGIEDIWISSIDYELLKRHYNIHFIKFIKIYGFRTSHLLFIDYVSLWYEKKNRDNGAKKIVDKFMLNCLYGKFGSNHKGAHKIPSIDIETGKVEYKLSDITDMKKYYLPIAIAITSYAHKRIDDAIMATGYDKFVYCDTDSVHTLGDLPISMIDNKELGKFKLEGIETKSKYVRQKTYLTLENDKINITCAGMTDSMKENVIKQYGDRLFVIFTTGFTTGGKLLPKHVKGGIVLYETTFQIS